MNEVTEDTSALGDIPPTEDLLGFDEASGADKAPAMNPRMSGAASMVDLVQSNEAAMELARENVVNRAQSFIREAPALEPKVAVDGIKKLADRHDTPNATDAVIGAQTRQAATNPADIPYVYKYEDVEAGRAAVVSIVGEALSQNAKATKTSAKVAGFLHTLLIPDGIIKMADMLNEFDPAFTISDVLNLGDAEQRIRQTVLNMPPEEARKMVNKMVTHANSLAGMSMGGEGDASGLLQELLGGLDAGEDRGLKESILAVLDVAALVPIAGVASGGKKVVKAASDAARKAVKPNRGTEYLKRELEAAVNVPAPGSPASAAASTKDGAAKMLAAVSKNDDKALGNIGTNQAQTMEELVLPNSVEDALPTSAIGFDTAYLFNDEKVAIGENIITEATNKLSTRLKDTNLSFNDTGIEALHTIGRKDGRGFANESTAMANAVKQLGLKKGEYTVVKSVDADEWFIQAKETRSYGANDVGTFTGDEIGSGLRGGLVRRIWGNNVALSEQYMRGMNWAAKVSADEKVALNGALKGYQRLAGQDLVDVNAILKEGNKSSKYFTPEELVERGLSDKNIQIIDDLYTLSKYSYMRKNDWVRTKLQAEGFKEVTIGGKQKLVSQLQNSNVNLGADVIDLSSGKMIKRDSLAVDRVDYTVYKILGEPGSPRYGILRRTDTPLDLTDVPLNPLKKLDGYMPVKYNSPAYVRRVAEDGSSEAYETASSISRANERAAELEASGQGKFSVWNPSETEGPVGDYEELQSLFDQGLMYSSTRKAEQLPDADDLDNIRGVAESLNAMAHSTSRSAGISRWAETAMQRWNNTYAAQFGDFQMMRNLERGSIATKEEFAKAKALRDHILWVQGASPSQLSDITRSTRMQISDALFSLADKTPIGKQLTRDLASNISGITTGITDGTKKAAFAAFLGLNPARQSIVQMSMIPTYMGVKGGAKYAMNPKGFTRDFAALNAAINGVEGSSKAARAMMKTDEFNELADQYRKYGGNSLVDDHTFTLGAAADVSIKSKGAGVGKAAAALQRVAQGSKAAGFDFGTRRDKMAQFLFARNRFKETNGRLPQSADDWREVTNFSESLGLNMNASDPILTSNGVLGAVLQFANFGVKASARMVGAERNFTRSERLGMAAANLAAYGTAGYGVKELANATAEAMGGELSEDDRQTLENGYVGLIMDSVFSGFDDAGEDTDIASAAAMSPFSRGFFGATPDSLFKGTHGVWSLGYLTENSPFKTDFAGMSLFSGVKDALVASSMLAGNTHEPLTSVAAYGAVELLKKVPVFSNAMRGIMAFNFGYAVDALGNPIVPSSGGEAVARMFLGLPNRDEKQLGDAKARLYGPFDGISGPKGMLGTVEGSAKDMAKYMIPYLRDYSTGKVNQADFLQFVKEHGTLMEAGLDPSQRKLYWNTVNREIEKSGVIKEDAFIQQMFRKSNEIPKQDMLDLIKDFDLTGDSATRLRTLLEQQLNFVNNQ